MGQKIKIQFPFVAIPSNRVNVSYYKANRLQLSNFSEDKSQSPQIGSMFLTFWMKKLQDRWEQNLKSQSPQIGSMFLTSSTDIFNKERLRSVAIPSNRVNVSYSTHLFLRIIGNLTPLFREPHYFYAFFFPI